MTDPYGVVRYAEPNHNPGRGDITLGDFFGLDDGDGVVFCRRSQELSARFMGIVVPDYNYQILEGVGYVVWFEKDGEGPAGGGKHNGDGFCSQEEFDAGGCEQSTVVETCLTTDMTSGSVVLDLSCLRPEELALTMDNLDANSFNFLLPNIEDSGVHTVEVEAWLDSAARAQQGEAKAAATIGLGSMIIQVIRLVKDDVGASEPITSVTEIVD